ncbi:hypothetical protein D1831_12970 [Lactiplantibacillus garii]|uniref:Uncharacterized protein n=1 Tax=Lactiplantibacillus garii TaxID=2306423 RepID=A0A3R8KGJ2_9LACO|nr:hypothetical protein [Lactiplantibacillus garii]RRK09385.1 hypothetical protein D1831_12970 [Lactiplantibacillus garii]
MTASAQSVHQKIPKAYRGTWKLKHASNFKIKKHSKLIVKSRYVKGPQPIGTFKGHKLGVHKGKKFVSFYLINKKGHQVSESTTMRLTHYKHKKALAVGVDVSTLYFTK